MGSSSSVFQSSFNFFLISILSVSLAAALLGFLKFNWEPARIYLGDAGSMFIGLVIGALVIMGDYTMYNDLAWVSGILILSIPIFDMVYVIILRLIKGKSPFFRGFSSLLPYYRDHLSVVWIRLFGKDA